MVQGLATRLLGAAERLAVAIACDRRQEAQLLLVSQALLQIVALGHGPSVGMARVAIQHLRLSREPDRDRDEHVLGVARGVGAARLGVRLLGRALDRAAMLALGRAS